MPSMLVTTKARVNRFCSVCNTLTAISHHRATCRTWPSGVQLGEPAQRTQTRKEAVLATPRHDEARHVLQAPPDRPLRDGDAARSVAMPGHRVLLARVPDEVSVVDPFGLDELELPVQVGADEDS